MYRWTDQKRKVAEAWIVERSKEPTADQSYLMQIAAEVRKVLHSDPKTVELDHFKLTPKEPEKPVKLTPEQEKIARDQATARGLARWFALTGYKPGDS